MCESSNINSDIQKSEPVKSVYPAIWPNTIAFCLVKDVSPENTVNNKGVTKSQPTAQMILDAIILFSSKCPNLHCMQNITGEKREEIQSCGLLAFIQCIMQFIRGTAQLLQFGDKVKETWLRWFGQRGWRRSCQAGGKEEEFQDSFWCGFCDITH